MDSRGILRNLLIAARVTDDNAGRAGYPFIPPTAEAVTDRR